jgi:hypothetical protein
MTPVNGRLQSDSGSRSVLISAFTALALRSGWEAAIVSGLRLLMANFVEKLSVGCGFEA